MILSYNLDQIKVLDHTTVFGQKSHRTINFDFLLPSSFLEAFSLLNKFCDLLKFCILHKEFLYKFLHKSKSIPQIPYFALLISSFQK